MIIYGVSAETSIGGLFLAGVIPGLLMAGALMVMVRAIAIRLDLPRHPFPGLGDLWRALRRAFWALLLPVILFAGLFGGVFTPTEAAAISVAYALALGLFGGHPLAGAFVYAVANLALTRGLLLDGFADVGALTTMPVKCAASRDPAARRCSAPGHRLIQCNRSAQACLQLRYTGQLHAVSSTSNSPTARSANTSTRVSYAEGAVPATRPLTT